MTSSSLLTHIGKCTGHSGRHRLGLPPLVYLQQNCELFHFRLQGRKCCLRMCPGCKQTPWNLRKGHVEKVAETLASSSSLSHMLLKIQAAVSPLRVLHLCAPPKSKKVIVFMVGTGGLPVKGGASRVCPKLWSFHNNNLQALDICHTSPVKISS